MNGMLSLTRPLAPLASTPPSDMIPYGDAPIHGVETDNEFNAYLEWRDGRGPFISPLGIEMAWHVRQRAYTLSMQERGQAQVHHALVSTATGLSETVSQLLSVAQREASALAEAQDEEAAAKAKNKLADTVTILQKMQATIRAARVDQGGAGVTLLQQFNNGKPPSPREQKIQEARNTIARERAAARALSDDSGSTTP